MVDFLISAVAIGPAMETACQQGVGRTVWEAIHAARALVPTNTNLGTVLLLAPLAAVPCTEPSVAAGVPRLLIDRPRQCTWYAGHRLPNWCVGRRARSLAAVKPVDLLALDAGEGECDCRARRTTAFTTSAIMRLLHRRHGLVVDRQRMP